MPGLKQKFKALTIIRLISGCLALLIALGRFEYKLLARRRARPTWQWLNRLGYGTERLIIVAGLGLRRLLIGLLLWPWQALKLITWPISWLIGRGKKLAAGVRLEPHFIADKAKTTVKHLTPHPHRAAWRPVAAFAVLIIVLILPLKFYGHWQALNNLKHQVLTAARAAIDDAFSAKQAVEQKDFSEANRRFSQASTNFMAADAELQKVNGFLLTLTGLLPNAEARLAAASADILAAGSLGSGLAADLSAAADSLFGPNRGQDIVAALAGFTEHGAAAKAKADQLAAVLSKINPEVLPPEYWEDFNYFKDRVAFLSVNLGELVEMSAKLRDFLGETYDKRYLLVFQNNTEARATGGFMGSFAVVDFSRGKIKSIQVPGGGTYDTEAGLRRVLQSPAPLQLVKARWYMWDANWWPDWPISARKIMWFYDESDGSTVDGVISLTPEVIIRLLKITGPIDLTADYGTTVGADNFMDVIQPLAEQKDTATPKKIIGDLLDKLIAKLTTESDQSAWLKIVGVIEQSLNEKHLLLYFTDPGLEAKVAELGWDGRLKETGGDYLAVINSNIAGGKSDKKIKQTVELTTNILSDGTLVDNLKIIRDHQAVRGEPFSGVRNVNWLRVYVPLGSQLIEAEGFKTPDAAYFDTADPSWELDKDLINEREAEVDNGSGTLTYREQDKTVFANWSMVDPGEIAVIKLSYKLPFKLAARTSNQTWLDRVRNVLANNAPAQLYRHSLLVQKQSGAGNSEINYKLAVPSNYDVVWQYPEGVSAADYLAQDTDKYWGYILQDKK